MPVLSCNVKNCYYNKEEMCCREGINVEGNTAEKSEATSCGSFKEKLEGNFKNSCKCGMEPDDKLTIDCEAEKCVYNSSHKCTAGNVKINGVTATSVRETNCASFAN